MHTILNDIRYAVRALRHSSGFTAVVVLTLALGIGANTAIFSVVRGVLLKSLPHRDGGRLVYLRQSADGPGQSNLTFSVPEVRDLRTGVTSLAGIAEYSSWSSVLQKKDGPLRLSIGLVTGNYFEVMGLSPIIGRVTQPGEDDGPTAAPVAVLTYQFWMSRFGGDSSVVGKPINLDNRPVTVIGVLQPAPFFPERIDLLANMVNSAHHMGASMQENRSHRMTEVVARLRPDATLEQVRSEVGAVHARLTNAFKQDYSPAAHFRVTVTPFKDVMGERARLTLMLLMAAAAFVLIVSGANVANLTLMRGVRRDHELVMRAALGAGAGQLRRLLLAENLVLAVAGAGIGIIIASYGTDILSRFAARYSSRADEIGLDAAVFGFTFAVAVGIAMLLSLVAPLPQEGRLAGRLLTGGQRASAGSTRQRMQRGLVVLQIAVSVVLLASAGLLARTIMELNKVDTGLRTEDVLTMRVSLMSPGTPDSNVYRTQEQHFAQIIDEIKGLPGVAEVGLGSTLPLRTADFFNLLAVEGRPVASGEPLTRAEYRAADVNYFRASGIPLIAGREFHSGDGENVAIINKALADRAFPNENPLGRRIGWKSEWRPDTLHWQTIVGVVGSTRDGGLDAVTPRNAVYMAMTETPSAQQLRYAGVVVRSDSRVKDLGPQALRIIRRLEPTALVEQLMTIQQFKEESVSPRRLNAILMSSFGILAVLIATVGIAGVLAFSVSARTNEIGIRMSLGADGGRVQRMILREGGTLVAIGLALGVSGAFAATQIMRELLFGVRPNDPVTFVAVAVAMAAVGLVACWIPALRAARIDPAITMRA